MMFVLGIIVGILISIIIIVALILFKKEIEKKFNIFESKINNIRQESKGFIFMPTKEDDEIRESIIERNRQKGLDTHISELL